MFGAKAWVFFYSKAFKGSAFKVDISAAEAGLQPGDRIISVNGTAIGSYDDLKTFLKTVSVGDPLRFVISRSGQPLEITVTAGEYVPEQIQKQNNSNI